MPAKQKKQDVTQDMITQAVAEALQKVLSTPQPEDEQKVSLWEAITKVTQEVTDPKREAEGFGYKYATLPQVLQILRPLWRKYGIGVVQHPIYKTAENGRRYIELHTIITNGKERTEFVNTYPVVKGSKMNEIQEIGATETYARRYTLSAIFGIASEDDTDGVVDLPAQPHNNGSAQGKNGRSIEYQTIMAMLEHVKKERERRGITQKDVLQWVKDKFKKDHVSALTLDEVRQLLKALKDGELDKEHKEQGGK